jgi:hypothetical protein
MVAYNLKLTIKVPDKVDSVAIAILLFARRLRYGYPFRRIKLTQGKFAIVDPDDFERINQYKWYYNKGYALRHVRRNGKKRAIFMHSFVCPVPPGMFTDHINRNRLDNRKANLRPATFQQNIWNASRKRKTSASPYKGVTWSRQHRKWMVRIYVGNKAVHLGFFKDDIKAAKAYDRVAKKLRGEYEALNFPKRS